MPQYTDFSQGRPFWVELGSPDIDASIAFYGHLFGWGYEEEPPGDDGGVRNVWVKNSSGYSASVSEGDAGEMASGTRPRWKVYLAVDGLDEVVGRVSEFGGKVEIEPFDVADAGRSAEVVEPGGGRLALWQSKGSTPVVQHEHGSLQWAELMTNDPVATAAFFRDVLKVKTEPMEMGDGSVNSLVMVEERPVASISALSGLSAELIERAGGPMWVTYFNVDDVDAAVERAVQNGGELPDPPWDVPGVGRMAWIYDPQGALLGLITPAS